MTAVRPYYAAEGASALHYDLVNAGDPSLVGDVDIYAALAPAGASILELGAGTGRVAIPLAERGFTVTGLDIAPVMARPGRGEARAAARRRGRAAALRARRPALAGAGRAL